MPSSAIERFELLKQRVLRRPRLAGIYILDAAEPVSCVDPEVFVKAFAAHHGFGGPDVGPAEWTNAEAFREEACERLVEALVGGTAIGHSVWDVEPHDAQAVADEFVGLFDSDARFFCDRAPAGHAQMLCPYARADLQNYIFGGGCIAVDAGLAAVFWVLDND